MLRVCEFIFTYEYMYVSTYLTHADLPCVLIVLSFNTHFFVNFCCNSTLCDRLGDSHERCLMVSLEHAARADDDDTST